MKTLLALILSSSLTFGQNCAVFERLFYPKDTSSKNLGRLIRFVIPDSDFETLPQDANTKLISEPVFKAQHHIHDATNFIRAKNYGDAILSLSNATDWIQKAQHVCPSLKFMLWKQEIRFYETAISIMKVAKEIDSTNTKTTFKDKLKADGYTITEDSTGLHATKSTPSTETNSRYYPPSYSSSVGRTSRTKRVGGYRLKNGTYVQSYYRSPRGTRSYSGSRKTYKSRSRRR